MNRCVKIENKDVFIFIQDKLDFVFEEYKNFKGENSNQYFLGQMAMLRKLQLIFSQILEKGWNKENVINNFYILSLKSKKFEKKYKEIWKKENAKR